MNPERYHEQLNSSEKPTELDRLGRERLEELKLSSESAPKTAEQRAEAAREALRAHEAQPEPAAVTAETSTARPSFALKLDRMVNYRQTVQSLQRRLDPASRAFSRLIHNDVVDSVSETAGRTVLRPSVVTGGLWGAALVGGVFYLTARRNGFPLSGSEMLVSLVAGGVIGYLMELGVKAFRRR